MHLLLSSVEGRVARWKGAASFVKKTEAKRKNLVLQELTGYGDFMPFMKILHVDCWQKNI